LSKGTTKANDFLCSSILAVLLTVLILHQNDFINNFYGKKSSAFASVYLLASIMYCNLLWE